MVPGCWRRCRAGTRRIAHEGKADGRDPDHAVCLGVIIAVGSDQRAVCGFAGERWLIARGARDAQWLALGDDPPASNNCAPSCAKKSTTMKLNDLPSAFVDDLVAIRRDIHANPNLAFRSCARRPWWPSGSRHLVSTRCTRALARLGLVGVIRGKRSGRQHRAPG